MTFNIFMTQGVSCFGQDDRIHGLISPDLRGNKCAVFRQLLVDEFHFPAVFKRFDPLLVWHVRRKDPFKRSVSRYHAGTLNSLARHPYQVQETFSRILEPSLARSEEHTSELQSLR